MINNTEMPINTFDSIFVNASSPIIFLFLPIDHSIINGAIKARTKNTNRYKTSLTSKTGLTTIIAITAGMLSKT